MKNSSKLAFLVLSSALFAPSNALSYDPRPPQATGSFATGKYTNYFKTMLGKSDAEVKAKVLNTFQQLFYGDDTNQRVYYPVGTDMAYIKDIANNDVRSEGMSYGMMIAVQLNKRDEFNRIWKWAKTHMQFSTGNFKDYFAWQCKDDGTILGQTPASDGEEYFITALLFAAGRWGNGDGIYNYQKEADAILTACLEKEKQNGGTPGGVTNLFNRTEKQVVFVPQGSAATFTDPSYHLPAFYEIWSRTATLNKDLWRSIAKTSRSFFVKAAHPSTGLFPDYSTFAGVGCAPPWNPSQNSADFNFDAWRVAMNIAIDYAWFEKDPWQITQTNRYLSFFVGQGIDTYKATYKLDGTPTATYRSSGLIAMNAVAATVSTHSRKNDFVTALWNQQTPAGQYRYY
ncbi:MAG TPA: glycosyl hydrolase family 8, partial [Fimbriimonas sp.]|nr:glycosyl hydrolase family 8 [Fimbriimonas sp.]